MWKNELLGYLPQGIRRTFVAYRLFVRTRFHVQYDPSTPPPLLIKIMKGVEAMYDTIDGIPALTS